MNFKNKAPRVTLITKRASGLEEVTLTFKGEQQTVLLFFPLVFTAVCTEEFCSITQDLDAYHNLDAAVYGISVDSPFAQEAWAKQNKITIPFLSDFNKKVSRAYGVLYQDLLGLKGVAKRAAFVVNKEGIITYRWVSEKPTRLPPFKKIQAALKNGSKTAKATVRRKSSRSGSQTVKKKAVSS